MAYFIIYEEICQLAKADVDKGLSFPEKKQETISQQVERKEVRYEEDIRQQVTSIEEETCELAISLRLNDRLAFSTSPLTVSDESGINQFILKKRV